MDSFAERGLGAIAVALSVFLVVISMCNVWYSMKERKMEKQQIIAEKAEDKDSFEEYVDSYVKEKQREQEKELRKEAAAEYINKYEGE